MRNKIYQTNASTKLIFTTMTLIVLFNILMLYYLFVQRTELKNNYVNNFENQIDISLGMYSEMADLIYNTTINKNEIKEIFYKGINSKTKSDESFYREELYNRLENFYSEIEKFNFRQLHFHNKNNISFLRFHKKDTFGDDLTKFRFTVVSANKYKKKITGFEEGKIFNGYRFVYPLAFNNEHIGSVEISVSMNSIISEIHKTFKNNTQFIILKSEVFDNVFSQEQSNYNTWNLNENFMLDKGLGNNCILENNVSKKTIEKINMKLDSKPDKPFSIEGLVDNHSSLVIFIPIKNFQGEVVAYVFSIKDSKLLNDYKNIFITLIFSLLILIILFISFITYKISIFKKIENMAIYDFLTKVYTRSVTFELLNLELVKTKKLKNTFSIIMIDIDFFKKVNDTFGHLVGDSVLVETAELISKNIRKNDFLGRFGGEEFLVLLPNCDLSIASQVAEKIRKNVESHLYNEVEHITISLGVAEFKESINSIEELIKIADSKLYEAKESGRNQVKG